MKIATFITLSNVARTPEASIKKALIALLVLCVFIITPRSLAEDLLSPIIGTVDASGSTPGPTANPTPSESPIPTVSPSTDPSPIPSSAPSSSDMTVLTSDTPTASASPTPISPHAITDQFMHLAVPSTVSTDPRAHTVFLPRLGVIGVDTLLICGYSNATSVSFTSGLPGVESVGSGSPYFRISGPTQLVLASLNSDMGARITSQSRALPGSVVSLSFVALSSPSVNSSLCNDGNPSNNRTISFRAISMDLNMVKDPVRLK